MSDLSFLELCDHDFKELLMKCKTRELMVMVWDLRDEFRNVLNQTFKDMRKKCMQKWYSMSIKQKFNIKMEEIK